MRQRIWRAIHISQWENEYGCGQWCFSTSKDLAVKEEIWRKNMKPHFIQFASIMSVHSSVSLHTTASEPINWFS
jgi:hypothetical protein